MKAFVFPGQGSQFPGMAKELYDNSADVRSLFARAEDALGFALSDVMFNGSADDLRATDVTQPAVFLHSVAAALSCGQTPDMVAGHSLGEFSALAAAGVLEFEDAVKLVAVRARAMQKCCENTPGAMAAVIALGSEDVERICAQINDEAGLGVLVAANYNCDGQIVISGTEAAIDLACVKMKEAGAKRALRLPVGGAFHSPLMAPAAKELAAAIDSTAFKTPICPVYQNVTASATTDPELIKVNLLSQLTSPVKWTQTVKNMLADGADCFVEFGPGAVLQGLVRKIVTSSGISPDSIEIKGF